MSTRPYKSLATTTCTMHAYMRIPKNICTASAEHLRNWTKHCRTVISPGALSTITLGTWKKMQKADFFRDGSLTSPEWKYIKSQKIPVVLNAWERKIQNDRHFADFENQTIANVIYDRVIYDFRGQKCIVILCFIILKSL